MPRLILTILAAGVLIGVAGSIEQTVPRLLAVAAGAFLTGFALRRAIELSEVPHDRRG